MYKLEMYYKILKIINILQIHVSKCIGKNLKGCASKCAQWLFLKRAFVLEDVTIENIIIIRNMKF